MDVVFLQAIEDLITAIPIGIKDDGKVCMVWNDIFINSIQSNSHNTAQILSIALHHLSPLLDLLIKMAKITEPHRSLKLIHLGVSTHKLHFFGSGDAVVLGHIQSLLQLPLAGGDRPTLDGVEDLGRMEAEHRGIPEGAYPSSFVRLSKGVGGIIENLEVVSRCNLLDGLHITDVAIDMDRNDCGSLLSDQGFDERGIKGVITLLDVTEDRLEAIADNGMRGGDKGEGGGDDLPGKTQGLYGHLEGEMAIGEERDMRDSKRRRKSCLQLFVFDSHIGKPMGVPERGYFSLVLFKGREG